MGIKGSHFCLLLATVIVKKKKTMKLGFESYKPTSRLYHQCALLFTFVPSLAKCLQDAAVRWCRSPLYGLAAVCGLWQTDSTAAQHDHVSAWPEGNPTCRQALGEKYQSSVCLHCHRLWVSQHQYWETLQRKGDLSSSCLLLSASGI